MIETSDLIFFHALCCQHDDRNLIEIAGLSVSSIVNAIRFDRAASIQQNQLRCATCKIPSFAGGHQRRRYSNPQRAKLTQLTNRGFIFNDEIVVLSADIILERSLVLVCLRHNQSDEYRPFDDINRVLSDILSVIADTLNRFGNP